MLPSWRSTCPTYVGPDPHMSDGNSGSGRGECFTWQQSTFLRNVFGMWAAIPYMCSIFEHVFAWNLPSLTIYSCQGGWKSAGRIHNWCACFWKVVMQSDTNSGLCHMFSGINIGSIPTGPWSFFLFFFLTVVPYCQATSRATCIRSCTLLDWFEVKCDETSCGIQN